MNPEFRRNLWLELTPRRAVTMTVVLLLVFFAAAISAGGEMPAGVAVVFYYFIVVIWGTRNAATSVVGEIRDRTWDLQRLSALSAGQMTWGKLLGSTAYNWFGGAICLAVIVVDRLSHRGIVVAFSDLVYFVVVGLIAQSTALLASLLASIRRQSHTRLEVFAYQAFGWIAALLVIDVWDRAGISGSWMNTLRPVEIIPWWGRQLDARMFLLLSLAAFAGWLLLGCYRAMRIELKLRNGPLVWVAFLLFMGIYVAGFDAWLPKEAALGTANVVASRLVLAGVTFAAITYIMVVVEPKDRVLYRWLGAELSQGHFGQVAQNLQGWMMSCKAAGFIAVALAVWLLSRHEGPDAACVGAAMGFLTRDVGIFVLLQSLSGRRRGDFAALVTLFVLYALAPAILGGLGLKQAYIFFYPQLTTPVWLSPLVAWMEAAVVAGLAVTTMVTSARRAAAAV